ncbi:MAG: NPCBM/NEW2 domain-containing protein [Thermoguttaceae bacterium]
MKRSTILCVLFSCALCPGFGRGAETVWLSSLDLTKMSSGWGKTLADKAVQGMPMSIAGRTFRHGVGTHAPSVMHLDLGGGASKFSAWVGVDDEVNGQAGSIGFHIYGDGKELWRSGLIRAGQPAKKVELDLKGIKSLTLLVDDGGDGINFDHADWAEAKFEVLSGKPRAAEPPREEAVILTPSPSPKPRINGPKVYGVRPGHPMLFTIPATGERPMEFAAAGLPQGLSLDPQTGRITGSVQERGEYVVKLQAKNALGTADRGLKIVVGDKLMLTPSMGWNSWYCFLNRVTEKDVRSAADAMVKSGMIQHGYAYVNIDDCWMVQPDSKDPLLGGKPRDTQGRLVPNRRFGDMRALTDCIHGKGLKAGIYISPGPRTCAGFEGSYQHEEQDARRFAEWGFDFLKYDWCSYGGIAKGNSREELIKPYRLMRAALDKQDRDIVLNLCQYGMGNVWEWGAQVGQSWRTTGDLGMPGNLSASMFQIGFGQNGIEKWAGPGHWNDPDYILVGWITWEGKMKPTPLTPNEQYTHVTLWSLMAAPLIFSGDMTRLDRFTLSLLTNDEVLEVNLDPRGEQAHRVAKDGELEVWAKDMEDGSKAVGLFNRGEVEGVVTAKWADLGVHGTQRVRDLWRQQDAGEFDGRYSAPVPRHGVRLVRLFAM